jgi:hypothetical protein
MLYQDVYGVILSFLRPLKVIQLASELSKPNDEVLQLGDAATVYLWGSRVLDLELMKCDYLEDEFARTTSPLPAAYCKYDVIVRLSESYTTRFINAHNPARVEEVRIDQLDQSEEVCSLPATPLLNRFRPIKLMYSSRHLSWLPFEIVPSLLNLIDVSLVKILDTIGIDADVLKRMTSLEVVERTYGFCEEFYRDDTGDEFADVLKNVHTIDDYGLVGSTSWPMATFERIVVLSPQLTKFGRIDLLGGVLHEFLDPFLSSL